MPVVARSGGSLFFSKQSANADVFIRDMTPFMWPSYRRTSLDMGGDHVATFTIDSTAHNVSVDILARWFDEWLGYHFEESYDRTVFQGQIYAMRFMFGGTVWSVTLDDMFNDVRVLYKAASSGSVATVQTSDSTSIAQFGTKQEVIDAVIPGRPSRREHERSPKQQGENYMTSGAATQKRDKFLQLHKWPIVHTEDIAIGGIDDNASLEIEVRGYIHTLAWARYKQTLVGAADEDVDTHIGTLISGHEWITSGTLASNTNQVNNEGDYQDSLQRLDALVKDTDHSYRILSPDYAKIDYVSRDVTTIKYTRSMRGKYRGTLRANGLVVPAPTITPGGLVFLDDMFMAGRPDAVSGSEAKESASGYPLNDPRYQWLAGVEYSADGLILYTGEQPTAARSAGAIALATEAKNIRGGPGMIGPPSKV